MSRKNVITDKQAMKLNKQRDGDRHNRKKHIAEKQADKNSYRNIRNEQTDMNSRTNTENAQTGKTNIKRIAFCGMFTAVAIIMGYIESFIVIPGLLPGMKLGLANCVILFVLIRYGVASAVLVSLVRIIVVNSLFGNMTAAVFSLAGAALSIFVMSALKKSGRFSAVGMSLAGGVAHNLGQVLVAMVIFENVGMFYYFPILIVSGVAAGVFVGIVAGLVYKKVKIDLI